MVSFIFQFRVYFIYIISFEVLVYGLTFQNEDKNMCTLNADDGPLNLVARAKYLPLRNQEQVGSVIRAMSEVMMVCNLLLLSSSSTFSFNF